MLKDREFHERESHPRYSVRLENVPLAVDTEPHAPEMSPAVVSVIAHQIGKAGDYTRTRNTWSEDAGPN
jgi:hypothetical protein